MQRRRDLVLTALVCAAAGIAAAGRPFPASARRSLARAAARLAEAPPARRRQGGLEAPADLVVINGAVYAADGGSLRQAVAVRGNRISAVGTNDEIGRLRGSKTQVVDAHGGAVVPGFEDVHAHMLSGGLEMETVNLQGAQTLQEIQSRIRTYADAHRDLPWIRGRGWGYGPFPDGTPAREQLDAAVPDRPAI